MDRSGLSPDLIDKVGIEVLNPIQWRAAGMDRRRLVQEFDRHVVFHGSIDNQQTLSFGSPEDVRREVAESVEIYADARWICAPATISNPLPHCKYPGPTRGDCRIRSIRVSNFVVGDN